MDDLRSLNALLAHEQRLRDEAHARVMQAQQRLQAAQAQAEQIGSYRGEYRQRWGAHFAGTASDTALLACYQNFGERLEQALEQQAQATAFAQAQLDRVRQALLAQELRLAAVGKLVERRRAQAQLAQARRDQKHSDEAAARTATAAPWRRPQGVF